MKKWLAFLLAMTIVATVHEGMHALVAWLYGECEALHIRPLGLEVQYRTPVDERGGVQWAFISGASNLVTILTGYLLLLVGERAACLRSVFLRSTVFYLTLILLLADPLNLSIGPFLYGGDANGIAIGLGLNRYVIQIVSLVILLLNRELVAQRLFPMYGVRVRHVLFRPVMRWTRRPG